MIFDWAWPKRCDRAAIDTLMTLEFLNDAANVVLVGPNCVGKSMTGSDVQMFSFAGSFCRN
jgi:hypothetical protein